MISKTHRSAQKLRGRQLNTKVCGCKIAIFLILLSFFLRYDPLFKQRYLENGSSALRHFITKLMLITARSYTTTQRLHSSKFTALPGCCPLRRTPFSNVVRMRTCSLVPKPKTTVIGLGARLVHTWNRGWPAQRTAGTVSSRSSGQGLCCVHHLSKVLHLAAYI